MENLFESKITNLGLSKKEIENIMYYVKNLYLL